MAIADLVKGKPNVEKAQTEVQRLAEAERRWSQVAREKAAERSTLEQQTGSAVLELVDGESDQEARQLTTARKLAEQIARLTVDVETAERTVQAARQQRPGAIRAVWALQAAELRAQAATLRKEADGREAKTRELRAKLEEWEECAYAPAEPSRPGGPLLRTGGAPDVVYLPTPKTERLRQQAAQLEHQAAQFERRPVVQAGQIEGASGAELVELLFSDVLRMGPAPAVVLTWGEAAIREETARRGKLNPMFDNYLDPATPIVLRLRWQGELIDARNSGVVIPPRPITDAERRNANNFHVYTPQEMAALAHKGDAPLATFATR